MGDGMRKIGFIGAGNMATAIVKGLLSSGRYEPGHLMTSDCREDQLDRISEQFRITCSLDNRDIARESDIIVLSVKPQSMREALEGIREEIREDHLLISIAAGIPLKMIHAVIGRDIALIRVMPNTPALIQKGISALAAGSRASSEHMDAARGIFDAVGETVVVEEAMMDAVTAISGSGPGYVFKIMECFVEAGEGLGFDRETALKLVIETFLGAALLAKTSEKSLAHLREMVTSPGGTTAAGLAVVERRELNDIIRDVANAAHERGKELGKNY
jgi:pyrroline-5-carboxylate reductase